MSAFVIALSGPPGAGKTTLARALAAALGGAPVLSYDDYERITSWPPERVLGWLARGAPFAEIPVPGLAADLAALRRDAPDAVVFDTLLGRAHPETAASIDHQVWLDTPPDLALARKLATMTEAAGDPRAAPDILAGLERYLALYETLLRPTYAVQRERIRARADQILPPAPAADLAAAIVARVRERRLPPSAGRGA